MLTVNDIFHEGLLLHDRYIQIPKNSPDDMLWLRDNVKEFSGATDRHIRDMRQYYVDDSHSKAHRVFVVALYTHGLTKIVDEPFHGNPDAEYLDKYITSTEIIKKFTKVDTSSLLKSIGTTGIKRF